MKIATSRGSISSQTTLSRARAPHGAPTAGSAPYFTGANILTDPGFESFVENSGGWWWVDRYDANTTTSYALPRIDLTCTDSYLSLPDGTCATKTFTGWAQANTPYDTDGDRDDNAWKVSVHNPHSGDYHAIWWEWNSNGFFPADICAFSPFISAPFSARVKPSDAVTWSAYLKVSFTTGTPACFPFVRFFDQSFTVVGTVLGTLTNLTTSYAQFSMSTSAPPNSYYMRACFGFSGGSGNEWPVQMDTAVLGVQP